MTSDSFDIGMLRGILCLDLCDDDAQSRIVILYAHRMYRATGNVRRQLKLGT